MKIRGFYPYWRCYRQEKALDEASARGQQLVKAGIFSTQYRQDDTCAYRHCLCLYSSAKRSASRLQSQLAWQREGWEAVCERGDLVFYRCPADAKSRPLKDNGLCARLARRIRSMELVRIVLLVLAVVCIMFGYAIDRFMIVRASILPLAVALVLTLIISEMQKSKAYIEAK